MKIGIDIHGVIDKNPKFFEWLTWFLKEDHYVYIVTGLSKLQSKKILEEHNIFYDKIFSITDYHIEMGTDVTFDEKREPHMRPELWDKTKAEYCERELIDYMIDDSDIYGKYFNNGYVKF